MFVGDFVNDDNSHRIIGCDSPKNENVRIECKLPLDTPKTKREGINRIIAQTMTDIERVLSDD